MSLEFSTIQDRAPKRLQSFFGICSPVILNPKYDARNSCPPLLSRRRGRRVALAQARQACETNSTFGFNYRI